MILLKSVLAFAFKEGDRLGVDPWGGYEPTVAKQKVSAALEKHRHVFSRHEVQAIIAYTSKTRDPNTIDYWGPLFGAYNGLRLEEISQVRTVDLSNEEGFLCVTITDAGELQTVKNPNSFRTIPIHQDLIRLGFGEFVERRSKASGDMLFMESDRWHGSLHEIKPDGQGRHGTMYGSRFADKEYGVLAKLNIIGHKVGFHSFRHAWTDLARNAGINPEHRRALAGRDSEAENEGVRTDNTENRYGHGFDIEVLAKSLNQLKPLV
ncbi:hypothetical protein DS909_05590 [Phaeobacter gallaeciensis]|uniref:Tyr recombinase domain-containing protein n=1 Tax=Phaeobacter gallaeciensis TaxID=60890 RepID=A0A366X522_9RHOB|nr:hypothetical protein DS909_05590 [Phaeobacter gallaeciensis]